MRGWESEPRLEACASLGTGASEIVHLDVGLDVVEDALGAAAAVADVRGDAGDALEVPRFFWNDVPPVYWRWLNHVTEQRSVL